MEINLQANEGIILQREYVYRSAKRGPNINPGSLVLTNQNLYYQHKTGTFRSSTETLRYPLNQIKKVNGQPQVMVGGDSLTPVFQIFLLDQQESFTFSNVLLPSQAKKEINNWISQIYQILGSQYVPDAAGGFSGVMKDTVSAVRDTLGIKSAGNIQNENFTFRCIGCRAPLVGRRGQVVRCKYCDTSQTLED